MPVEIEGYGNHKHTIIYAQPGNRFLALSFYLPAYYLIFLPIERRLGIIKHLIDLSCILTEHLADITSQYHALTYLILL